MHAASGRGGFFFTKGVLLSIKWVWLTQVPYKFMCIKKLCNPANPPAYGPALYMIYMVHEL
jgi:hypothetical protein